MKKLALLGVAAVAIVLAPLLDSANAQSRKNTGANYGYCKSGEKVRDMKECKENGGKM